MLWWFVVGRLWGFVCVLVLLLCFGDGFGFGVEVGSLVRIGVVTGCFLLGFVGFVLITCAGFGL